MARISLLLLCLSSSTALHAQAFGVQMGVPVSKYQARVAGDGTDPNAFRITVPEPNSEFEGYLAFATPQTGVCKVIGLGKTHANDAYGTETRSAFDRFRSALVARYGKSSDYDFLRSGALWKEPQEWVWSIYKKERTMTSFWIPSSGAVLPAELSAIRLDARSINPASGAYLVLDYEFANFAQCKKLMDQRDNTGL